MQDDHTRNPAPGADLPPLAELARRFRQLPPAAKRRVHQHLCTLALARWQRFAAEAGPITYVDSVIGMWHSLDMQLPADALGLAFGARPDAAARAEVEYRYREPIVALQDDDFELPGAVLLGYYAIYNAFLKYVEGRAIDDWLIVNQALSILGEERDWAAALAAALAAG